MLGIRAVGKQGITSPPSPGGPVQGEWGQGITGDPRVSGGGDRERAEAGRGVEAGVSFCYFVF